MNKKKFIILSPGIWDMGGSQMYTRNKIKYMQEKLHEVYLFHSGINGGEVIINDLIKYSQNLFFHLNYPAYIFSKRIQDEIVDKISSQINSRECDVVIESHSTSTSTWGELISKKLNARHIIFLLSEKNSIRNIKMFKFFKFKLKRGELVGIMKPSIKNLFYKWMNIDNKKKLNLNAICYNVVEDIKYPRLNEIPKSDYTIGSIGRINKVFVINIIEELIEYVINDYTKTYTLLLIGGEPINSKTAFSIKNKIKKIKNFKVFITGYIYPLPKDLILIPDVFISASSSCLVSSVFDIPTIPIDYHDNKPIGVYGHTTNNTLFRNNEPIIDLPILLNEILVLKKYKFNKILKTNLLNQKNDFSDFDDLLKKCEKKKDYFNFHETKLSKIDKVELFSLNIFGDYLYRIISMKIFPLWKKIKQNQTK